MIAMKTMIPVYHADYKEQNDKFISGEKTLLASFEDGYWCGKGMYFWDNKSNAEYWKKELTKRKSSELPRSICLASLQYEQDDCLDMTDEKSAESLFKAANEFLNKMDPSERPRLDMHKTGAVINFVHNALEKKGIRAFKVVKMSGDYPNKKKSVFNEKYGKAHATLKNKIIYSVRDGKLLTERMEVS